MIVKAYLLENDNLPQAILLDASFIKLFFNLENNVLTKVSKNSLKCFLDACYQILLDRTLEFSKMILPNEEKDYSIRYETSVELAFSSLTYIYSRMGENMYFKVCI